MDTKFAGGCNYEFAKAFLTSAEEALKSFDEIPSTPDSLPDIAIGSELEFPGGSDNETVAGLIFGVTPNSETIDLTVSSPKFAFRQVIEEKQKLKKRQLIALLASESPLPFQDAFRKIFIECGIRTYHTYESKLTDIYIKSDVASSGNIKGKNKSEDLFNRHRQAIQILGSYAGACCFEFLLTGASKAMLLQALTKQSILKDVTRFWEFWTVDSLYYDEFPGQKIGPYAKKTKYISPYKFFLQMSLTNQFAHLPGGPITSREYQIREKFTVGNGMKPISISETIYTAIINEKLYSLNNTTTTN